ncbi:hypothetical protein NDU88_000642 [Pleurodeles waltl]|uniref:Uncharacterized protein n=1 Tax=Pleurodeles waltl TaxID=8319 RepID=A0AAV7MHG1_PLEWA|nr:hypothetical protein NDU88_000642 [Pleurodeles waltl]
MGAHLRAVPAAVPAPPPALQRHSTRLRIENTSAHSLSSPLRGSPRRLGYLFVIFSEVVQLFYRPMAVYPAPRAWRVNRNPCFRESRMNIQTARHRKPRKGNTPGRGPRRRLSLILGLSVKGASSSVGAGFNGGAWGEPRTRPFNSLRGAFSRCRPSAASDNGGKLVCTKRGRFQPGPVVPRR